MNSIITDNSNAENVISFSDKNHGCIFPCTDRGLDKKIEVKRLNVLICQGSALHIRLGKLS